MMKFVLIVTSLLFFINISMSSQTVKKDTLTDEQKETFKKIIMPLLMSDSEREEQLRQDSILWEKEQYRQDSILKTVETKYKPGAPSVDFKYKDVNGKVVSLKDLRGKYVYIDVWATWCGPCCQEIPFLQELEERMKGKKISFVSISWDRKRNEWVKALQEKKLGGIQLHFGGDDKFFKEYGIEAIPRFILLDKKGKVVDAYMTRPSDPKTEETFSKLKGL